MFHRMKQLTTKLSPNMHTTTELHSEAARLSYLRQIQRDARREDVLDLPFRELPVVIIDLETNGFHPDKGDEILSIGAIKMKGEAIDKKGAFYATVQCVQPPSKEVLELTGLSERELMQSASLADVLTDFYRFVGHTTLVAHHASHEKKFMAHATWQTLRTTFKHRIVDTSFLLKVVAPERKLRTLEECCAHYEINIAKRHHAQEDAIATAKLWGENVRRAQEAGFHSLRDVYMDLAKRT